VLAPGLGRIRLAFAEVIAAGAEAHAAIGTNYFVILAQSAAATRADGDGGTMTVDDALGDQASGNHLLAPAFGFDEGSHGSTPSQ
jgi:hypothetical protein